MSCIVESIPNFSEGRRIPAVEKIERGLSSVTGVSVLDRHVDSDHNRSVITVAGHCDSIPDALLAGVHAAIETIDLRVHQGQHPRVGAVDVIPLVPLKGLSLSECVRLAERVGQMIAETQGIPVYLYEAAARDSSRMRLERIRKLGFERLRDEIALDPALRPDFGPSRLHPTAGATFVGARRPLIAFNINLDTPDVTLARQIAAKIRESSGGLPGIKALGLFMETSSRAQVSMNLTDYRRTGLRAVFQAVDRLASEAGAAIHSSELVGLAPEAALENVDFPALKIEAPARSKILERRLEAAGLAV